MPLLPRDVKTLQSITAAAQKALAKERGANDRLRGQVKRLTAKLAASERLAEARIRPLGRGTAARDLTHAECYPDGVDAIE